MTKRFAINTHVGGFTIVELLIVIVVIGILAAISIASYSGIQNRANMSKIDSDMRNLKVAIDLARTESGLALRYITLNTATGGNCWSKADDTDLAALPKSDFCWTGYISALNRISIASGMNIRGLTDPWGRPYYIDENEGEGVPPETSCVDDAIGYYARPFTMGQTMTKYAPIRNVQPLCQ